MLARGCIALTLLLFAGRANAQVTKTLAGRWSASTMRTSYTSDPWGDACGPKPSVSSEPGGIVTITQRGQELTLSGLGRSFGTANCWETIPGGRTISHTAAERSWRTVCQSPAGDSRRSAVTTSLTATDDRIDFVETGQFEYSIGAATCHAIMRRSRSFALVERDGEVLPPPQPEQAEAPHTEEALGVASRKKQQPESRCSEPGSPARIEVSPSRKLLRAGEQFAFRVKVLDRNGCYLDRPVTWKLVAPSAQVSLSPQGQLKVLEGAKEERVELSASVQDHSLTVVVDIVSEERYKELLSVGTFDATGETKETAATAFTSSSLGTRTTTAENAANKRRVVFIWAISAIALALGLGALFLALSRRKMRAAVNLIPAEVPSDPSNLGGGARRSAAPGPLGTLVCPTCQEEYPPERKFCAVDGNRLIALPRDATLATADGGICPVCRHGFDPGVARCPVHDEELVPAAVLAPNPTATVSVGRRICPLCGTIYSPDTQFCGNDGAALVPIN